MRIILSLILLFSINQVNGQIIAEKKAHNFGDLYPNATTYVDIKFTNKSGKKHYLLNVDKPRDVYYIFSSKVLLPDSSITIRLKVNDGRKGRFDHEVDIYFSDSGDPTTIRLHGNVKEVSANPLTECPDFDNSKPPNERYEFAVTIKVIDSLTREPIRRSRIYVVQNNSLIGQYYTNKDGIVHEKLPMGYYFVTAEKESYINNYNEGYMNFQQNYMEIELQQPITISPDLDPDEFVINDAPNPPNPDLNQNETEIVIDLNEEDPVVEEPPVDTIPEIIENEPEPEYIVDVPLSEIPDSVFDASYFKMNNITFILDVSSSMNSSGKLELLKQSMTELVNILRPEDVISVIKYSSNVSVVVDGLSGDDKEEINERVAELRTSSSTAGGDAINMAYTMNRKVYSPKRNNIVIMITDGAFNKGSKNYLENIEKNYNERGILFSVVGIKTSSYISDHMENVVSKGGGSYVEVRNIDDAETKIINEIRRTSFRGRDITAEMD